MRAWRAGVKREPVPLNTHCVQSHEFTPENTYKAPDGSRQCRECRRVRLSETYYRHHDRYLAERAVWRDANRELHNERSRRWQHENPEKVNMISRLKKQRRRAAGTLTDADWALVLEVYGNACLKCGKPETTIDHVMPVVLGGLNVIDNVQPLCGRCNSSKGPTFADYRPFPIEELMLGDEAVRPHAEPADLVLF